jgi:hypothetical protein
MVEIKLPIRTVSEANARGHWAAKAKRVRSHRVTVGLALRGRVASLRLPAVVVLTRVAPSSGLDGDNLLGSLKACRDGVADALGVDDRDPRVRWEYRQERGPYAVVVRVMAASEVETPTPPPSDVALIAGDG